MVVVHGTCVDLGGSGVLLRGPPGSGKSDLALRLIDGGARLIADDQVEITRDGDVLMARAPLALKGRMEIRGIGIVPADVADEARLRIVIDLVPRDAVERLPEPLSASLLDIALPAARLAAFDASAPAKVRAFARLHAP